MNKKIILLIIVLITLYICNYLYVPSTNEFISWKSDKYKNTVFTTSFNENITPRKNLIYCFFYQNTLENLLHNTSTDTASINIAPEDTTNLKYEPQVLPPSKYFFKYDGKIDDQVFENLNIKLENKLSKSDTKFIDRLLKNSPYVIMNYYEPLHEFENNFEVNHILKCFNGEYVKCFGTESVANRKSFFKNHVKILYDFWPDSFRELFKNSYSKKNVTKLPIGFILQLITKTDIEIIISTIPPKNNMLNTYQEINDLINKNFNGYVNDNTSEIYIIEKIKKIVELNDGRILQIPEIKFKVYHQFFAVNNMNISTSCLQLINFNLSTNRETIWEKTEYEAHEKALSQVGSNAHLINKPFVIFIRLKSNNPYFMAYICNDEVLSPISE